MAGPSKEKRAATKQAPIKSRHFRRKLDGTTAPRGVPADANVRKRYLLLCLQTCFCRISGDNLKIRKCLFAAGVSRLRVLSKTTFIVLKDCSGEMQCVVSSDVVKDHHLKTDDAIEIRGKVRADERSKQGHEIDISDVTILNRSDNNLPF